MSKVLVDGQEIEVTERTADQVDSSSAGTGPAATPAAASKTSVETTTVTQSSSSCAAEFSWRKLFAAVVGIVAVVWVTQLLFVMPGMTVDAAERIADKSLLMIVALAIGFTGADLYQKMRAAK